MAEISLWRFAICADPIVAAIGVSRHAPIGPEGEAPIISYQMRLPIWENKASGKQTQRDQACRATITSALGVSKACGPARGPTMTTTLFDQPPVHPLRKKKPRIDPGLLGCG